MPEFSGFKRAAIRGAGIEPDYSIVDLSESDGVSDYQRERGVSLISRRDAFCSLTSNCGFKDEAGQLLLVDEDHLSPFGARLMGKELLEAILAERDN
jgi:hypothetical protein